MPGADVSLMLDVAAPSGRQTGIPKKTDSFRERHLLAFLYATLFLLIFGETIQQAPRTQIYQSIICREHHPEDVTANTLGNVDFCKSTEVQEDLAFLKGMERLLGAVPTLLAIPYGLLADRYGRSHILTLALTGLVLEETWSFMICWFSDYMNIRLVLLGVMFETVGGGFGVVTTMAHVIVADFASTEARTRTFFIIRAAGIIAAITGQTTSSLIMNRDAWVPWIIGLLSLFCSAAASRLIPNRSKDDVLDGKQLTDAEQSSENDALIAPNPAQVQYPEKESLTAQFASALESLRQGAMLLFSNSRLVLSLVLVFLCQLSEDSLPMLFLLYVSKRFSWDFARVNLLWALGNGVQLFMLVAVLPLSSVALMRYSTLDAYVKDVSMALASTVTLGIGSLLIGVAPNVASVVGGVVLFSTACGLQSLLRSLITDIVAAKDTSVVYSIVTILHVLSSSLAGPIYAGAFTAGLRIGSEWAGLPFMIAGALCAAALPLAAWMLQKPGYQALPGSDSEDDTY